MRACGTAVQFVASAILAGAGTAAAAQTTYNCTLNGRSWQSAQPCDFNSPPRAVIVPRSEPRLPPLPGEARPVDKAPEYLKFESAQEAYRQQCADEESRARNLLQDERNRQRDARDREERAARLERDREKLNREQCAEMKRILQSKRQRLETMTDGERGDFERFEATWRARCAP